MKHICIVDDDEEMTRAVRLMLKLLDCETKAFFNVRTAAQNGRNCRSSCFQPKRQM